MKCLDLGQWAVQQSHLSWVCPECCTVDQIAESSTEKEPIEEEPTEEEMLLKSLEMLASDIAAEKRPAFCWISACTNSTGVLSVVGTRQTSPSRTVSHGLSPQKPVTDREKAESHRLVEPSLADA